MPLLTIPILLLLLFLVPSVDRQLRVEEEGGGGVHAPREGQRERESQRVHLLGQNQATNERRPAAYTHTHTYNWKRDPHTAYACILYRDSGWQQQRRRWGYHSFFFFFSGLDLFLCTKSDHLLCVCSSALHCVLAIVQWKKPPFRTA